MSEADSGNGGTGWSDRVAFSDAFGGIAYRPFDVIVAADRGRDALLRFSLRAEPEPIFYDDAEEVAPRLYRGEVDADPLAVVEELRLDGVAAQPNHVLFAHGDCGCCGPHPASSTSASPVFASPVFASPVFASPVFASPVFASPVFASPVFASPVFASQYRSTGVRRSSARPCEPPEEAWAQAQGPRQAPRFLVLDTGFAHEDLRPASVGGIQADPAHWELPSEDNDPHLDPAAGHGTFIAGVIEQLLPGCQLTVERVLTTYGDGDEAAIAQRIRAAAGKFDLINLSFGGYALDRPFALAAAVRHAQRAGAVVVASAGNDGTCRPTYPAALPGVVGVGAVGPTGPAPFTNYGPWVRACAPGVDLVSSFFTAFDGPGRAVLGGSDPDKFESWAVWSGTSFAAPVVVAALAREMRCFGVTAEEAVRRVIDRPGLLRLHDLGTVVNLA